MSEMSAADQYLESMVLTASPQRLRLLLICKANQLLDELLAKSQLTWNEMKFLHLRDVLGELLSGVGRQSGELGQQVADLYVFLIQHLTRAELEKQRQYLVELRGVMQLEQETWEMVCSKPTNPAIPAPLATNDYSPGNFSLEM